MPTDRLDLPAALAALAGGLAALEQNRALVDDLNVFPVPDGDTGSNLLATARGGLDPVLAAPPADLRALLAALRRGFKSSSRGNSGFLFATFHEGFLATLEAEPTWTAASLPAAIAAGSYSATTSLLRPREGTMLSVMGAMAAPFEPVEHDLVRQVQRLAARAYAAVRRTPDQLSLLRRAGVVDSGGLGFALWVDGIAAALAGLPTPVLDRADWVFPPEDVAVDAEDEAAGHRYCTELIFENPGGLPLDGLRAWLEARGSSIALFDDVAQVKVHVHLDDPDSLRAFVAPFGAVIHDKVEDMHAQIVTRRVGDTRSAGVLAVVPGDGFAGHFAALGAQATLVCADRLPSLDELLAAVGTVEADLALVLPNDANIVPVALLAEQQHPERVAVLPTRTAIQGLCAMSLYVPGAPVGDCLASMEGWDAMAEELGLCQSQRDARFGGHDLPEGTWFTIRGDRLLSSDPDRAVALRDGVCALDHTGRSLLTLYRGADLADDEAAALAEALSAALPDLEVQVAPGGQRRYSLLVSLE